MTPTPEERFAKHKAGIRANRYVQRFGLRLPQLYAYANPSPPGRARQRSNRHPRCASRHRSGKP